MPEPNRPPCLIEPAIADVAVVRLIEQQAAIGLACHACPHRALWSTAELRQRFSRRPTLTFRQLAPRLRCGRCKSEWIEVGRADTPGAGR
jgi:hypothetical protein